MSAPHPAPMLLLPGLLCDARIWAPQLAAFESLHPVVVDDFYGDADSFDEMAERALAIAPRRFSLAGHSMGARVALEVYRKAPERVERLALLSTGTHPVKPGEAKGRYKLLALGRERGVDALVDAWLTPMVAEANRGPALMETLRQMCRDAGVVRYEAQITALLNRPTLEELLPTVACPTLVGVGSGDVWAPVVQHKAIAAAVPGAELTVFENSGHMAPVETPDQVNAALRRWLARAPTDHPETRHQEKTQ